MVVSFIGGGNPRKPATCHKSLTNFITNPSGFIGQMIAADEQTAYESFHDG
jgi:hypothetical protein